MEAIVGGERAVDIGGEARRRSPPSPCASRRAQTPLLAARRERRVPERRLREPRVSFVTRGFGFAHAVRAHARRRRTPKRVPKLSRLRGLTDRLMRSHADTYCRASATACSSVSPTPTPCSTSYATPRRSRAPDIK